MNEKKNYVGEIDFWKFIFSLIIAMYHARLFTETETPLFGSGQIAVSFFFLISGFLMAATSKKVSANDSLHIGKETTSFLFKKIRLIFPYVLYAYIVALGVHISFMLKEGKDFTDIVISSLKSVWELLLLRMTGVDLTSLNAAFWYVSSMLIAMLILYPLIIKNRDTFIRIIAPLLIIFLIGVLTKKLGGLRSPFSFAVLLTYRGNLEAIIQISLGCICYEMCEYMKTIKFTKFSKVALSFLQYAGYAFVILAADRLGPSNFDFVLLLILFISICITFSQQGILSPLFNNRLNNVLGSFSLILYVNHMYCRTILLKLSPDWNYGKYLLVFWAMSIISSVLCYTSVFAVKRILYKKGHLLKRIFITT